jgi:UDP-N-acetylmuramate dehydrogenase
VARVTIIEVVSSLEEAARGLAQIPNVQVSAGVVLSRYTRFGLGGPAGVFVSSASEEGFAAALGLAASTGLPWVVIGGGTNLIVADAGFPGIVLQFTGAAISFSGCRITAQAGAVLQDVVDCSIRLELKGLETLAGIPGWLGAAVYGNAGAYGHSISERVRTVRFTAGSESGELDNAGCEFRYRESVFKRRKGWIVLSAGLDLETHPGGQLAETARSILEVRNRKFPPDMRCAGSIFKNLLVAELPAEAASRVPPEVVREGKIPAAFFLEKIGAKGLVAGGIRVADYHANLLYNEGGGTAAELCRLIALLKQRVRSGFGIELEEEVQYIGFDGRPARP